MVSDDVEVVAARIEFQHWHLPASFFDFYAAVVGYLQKRVGFEVFGNLFPDVGPASFEWVGSLFKVSPTLAEIGAWASSIVRKAVGFFSFF